MANLKEVRTRIVSVNSTQQITKAMKMVSAAKLRRAQDRITQMRPYSRKLNEILSNIVSNVEGDIDLALATVRPIEKVLIVLITSDRGLCGAFNTNLIKTTRALLENQYSKQAEAGNVTIMTMGKKGADFYKKRFKNTDESNIAIFSQLNFDHVSSIAEDLIEKYRAGAYDRIDVVYAHFKNAATQHFEVEQFLPIPKVNKVSTQKSDYIFDPDIETILSELMPKILKTQFFRYLLETNASDHGARMTAMDKATDNAGELLKDLKIKYNRERQAAITTELSEIVSGAAALES